VVVLVAVLIAAVIGVGLAAGRLRPAQTSPAQAPSGPVRTFALFLDQAQVAATSPGQWAAIARRTDIVVLNSWDFRLIGVLKRANPDVQVWVYKDLSGVRSDDCTTTSGACGSCPHGMADSTFLSSGMGYCWVLRNHPRWLLDAAASGRPLEFSGYPDIWETNYGSGSYQRQWLRDVLADVRAHGWDGVDIDNALTTANAYGVAAAYPTSGAVQAATYSALHTIGPALQRAGVASVVNVGYAIAFHGLWQRWLGPVNGLEQEFYLSGGTRPAVGAGWQAYEDELAGCVAQHKSCWFDAAGQAARLSSQPYGYALASYLLVADGRQSLAAGAGASGAPVSCPSVGAARGPMQLVGRAWRRFFAHGVVLVNPTSSRQVVALGGSYIDQAGQSVSAVTLRPASGMLLGATRPGCT